MHLGLFLLGIVVSYALSFNLSARCPNSSDPVAWQQWQGQKTQELFSSEFKPETARQIKTEFLECQKLIDSSPQLQACTSNLHKFTTSISWETLAGHSLGASLSDEEYESDLPYPEMLELPKELQDNQEFLSNLDAPAQPYDPSSYKKAFEIIDKINAAISDPKLRWIPFVYDSQHLPTPDETGSMGRFFIYIPHPDYDRFIQFGLQSTPGKPLSKALSTVSIQKTDPVTHKPLRTARGRIKDFWRLRDENGKVTVSSRLKVVGKMENCYNCHRNFLLPIHPDPKTFDKARFQTAVDSVNEIMRNFGYVSADGYDHSANGPGIGPDSPDTRTDEFIRSCSNGAVTDPERIQKVKNAMNCTQCHDGLYRGTLNFPSGLKKLPVSPRSVWGSLIDHYIVKHKLMPPDEQSLNDDERKTVASCLKAEYYQDFKGQPGLFKSWILQNECWNYK